MAEGWAEAFQPGGIGSTTPNIYPGFVDVTREVKPLPLSKAEVSIDEVLAEAEITHPIGGLAVAAGASSLGSLAEIEDVKDPKF